MHKSTIGASVAGLAVGLLISSSAFASKYVITFDSGFEGPISLTVSGGKPAAIEDDNNQYFIAGGFIVKLAKAKQVVIGGSSTRYSGAIVIQLDYPLVTGGNYTIYQTGNGKTLVLDYSGHYTVQ